jgi:hypothetical protein
MKSSVFVLFASLAYCQTPLTTPVIVYPKADDSESGEIRLMEKRANGTNYVGFLADYDVSANILYKIPKVPGSPGQCWGYGGVNGIVGIISWVDCAGSLPVVDTTSIVKGSDDSTKQIRFEVDGLTTGTTRVLTPQDADYVLAGTNIAQTFTANQIFASGTTKLSSPNTYSPATLVFANSSNQPKWEITYDPVTTYLKLYNDYLGQTFVTASNTFDLLFGVNLIPDASGVRSLGSPSGQWKDIYYSGNLSGNTATFTGKVSLSGSAAQLYANYNGNVIYIDSTNTSPKAIWVVGGGVMANRGIFNETYVANVYSGAPDVGSPQILDTSRNLFNINNITYSGTLTGGSSSFTNINYSGTLTGGSASFTNVASSGTLTANNANLGGQITLSGLTSYLYVNHDGNIFTVDTANTSLVAIWIYNGGITAHSGSFDNIYSGQYIRTQILDSSRNMSNLNSFTVGSGNFYNRTFSGAPNCTGVTDGWTGVDTTNNRLYICIGGSARYVTLN